MAGFRSLADEEEVEFECIASDKGLEATNVTGPQSVDCRGSNRRPSGRRRFRRLRCYNCGEFANHIASKCALGPQPKKCHHCKSVDHLIADCPSKNGQAQPDSYENLKNGKNERNDRNDRNDGGDNAAAAKC